MHSRNLLQSRRRRVGPEQRSELPFATKVVTTEALSGNRVLSGLECFSHDGIDNGLDAVDWRGRRLNGAMVIVNAADGPHCICGNSSRNQWPGFCGL
jgi:hypothetical protein